MDFDLPLVGVNSRDKGLWGQRASEERPDREKEGEGGPPWEM